MTIPELIGLAVALCFAYPWALVALSPPRSPVITALTTVALSLGGMTLGMMTLALVAPGLLNLGVIGGLMALVFALGAWWLLEAEIVRGGAASVRTVIAQARRAARASPLAAGAVVVPVVMGALILFNAGYLPFGDQDAIAIYGRLGRWVYLNRTLPVGEGLFEAYPMLVPLSYTYTHLLAESQNEYLARLAPAALSVGAMAAAYALGRALYSLRTGVAAAALLALTPTYTRWASAGYADLPAAFFFTMSALFAWRLYESGRARDAALAGIVAGLAMWTKNGALTLAASLPLWIAYTRLHARCWPGDASGQPVAPRCAALALGAAALTAGPWYARNLLLFGVIVPPTGWAWLAQRTLANLVPFAAYPEAYFAPGLVFLAGIAACLGWAARGDARAAMLLIFAAPFFAVWWALFSYETRFLLMILPLVAVMGGRALDAAMARIQLHISAELPGSYPASMGLQWAALALLVALALPAASKAVMHKDDFLRNPLMDNAARHRLQTGPAFAVSAYLNDHAPAGARVLSTVLYVDYYADPDFEVVYNPPAREGYDYWVLAPGEEANPPPGALLAEIDGAKIYKATRHDE